MSQSAILAVLLTATVLAAPASRAQLAEESALRERVEESVERGLRYLASAQLPNGAFRGDYGSTAAVPALAGMAFYCSHSRNVFHIGNAAVRKMLCNGLGDRVL